MSRTYRKDKEGNKFIEGNPLKNPNINYKCRCEYCVNLEKKKLEKKAKLNEIKKVVIDFENRELL